jgi:hypothetical protein
MNQAFGRRKTFKKKLDQAHPSVTVVFICLSLYKEMIKHSFDLKITAAKYV